MDIIKYDGQGYSTVVKYGSWRIGLIRWKESLSSIVYFERHNLTDETFILLEGEATLYIADESHNYTAHKLEGGLLYNVKAAEWHTVCLSKDALVMVVENADTSRDNSEYFYI